MLGKGSLRPRPLACDPSLVRGKGFLISDVKGNNAH
jgi:hypothetical protein